MKKRMKGLAAIALLLVMAPTAGHDKSRKAECADIKEKIRTIESRMRAGYTPAQGLRYEQRLRKLKERRYKACR